MRPDVIAMNRFGLGARPGDGVAGDPRGWLIGQFARFDSAPPVIAALPDRATITADLADYFAAARDVRRARRADAPSDAEGDEVAERRARRRAIGDGFQQAVQARADSAVVSATPFVDRLVHFWSNHFAISAEKLPVRALAGDFEFTAIRPHVLGRFADMLLAVERHPAMLVYLDQAQSIGPNSAAAARARGNGRQRGLNENLAREIMELHTLGVRTGYAQADVTELARALTGWTAGGIGQGPARRLGGQGGFTFAPTFHEPGPRMLLGKRFAEGGEEQATAMLTMLAAHPATARHVATKLARHFAGDTPPPALVARLERAFLDSDGDLPTVYRALVAAPEAWAPQPVKFKTPWEWSVSASRAVGANNFPANNAAGFLTQLGQRIWYPGAPAGFDDVAAAWAGPDAVMRRVEASERIASRATAEADARATATASFGDALSPGTTQAVARAESPAQGIALLLVSPEFMRR